MQKWKRGEWSKTDVFKIEGDWVDAVSAAGYTRGIRIGDEHGAHVVVWNHDDGSAIADWDPVLQQGVEVFLESRTDLLDFLVWIAPLIAAHLHSEEREDQVIEQQNRERLEFAHRRGG